MIQSSNTNIRFGDDVSDSCSGTKSELELGVEESSQLELELGVKESSVIDEPLSVIGTITILLFDGPKIGIINSIGGNSYVLELTKDF